MFIGLKGGQVFSATSWQGATPTSRLRRDLPFGQAPTKQGASTEVDKLFSTFGLVHQKDTFGTEYLEFGAGKTLGNVFFAIIE